MSGFEALWARQVLQHPWLAVLIPLGLAAWLTAGMGQLAFDTSYRAYFSEDNPELLAFERIENTYVKDDNVMLVLAPADGNVFTRDTLSAIEKLTEDAWQTPFSNRVDSITNFQFTEAEADELTVRDMVSDALSLDADALQSVRNNVMAEPSLVGRLISAHGDVTAVNITVQLAPDVRADATQKIMAFVRNAAQELETAHPGLKVYITGMVPFDQVFLESSVYDTTVLFPIALGLMTLCLALLVGGFFGTLTTLLIMFMSIAAAMGAGGHLGFPLTGTSSGIPIIVLTVAVANAVHVLVTFSHGLHDGQDKRAAMGESLRVNLQPVTLASATTAIGFLTMNFSEVPPFAHLGTQVAVGVLVSYLLTVTFLPVLMVLMPAGAGKKKRDEDRLMTGLAEAVLTHRKRLLPALLLLVVAAMANLPRNEINDTFLYYFDESLSFRQSTDFMLERLTGIDFINYSGGAGSSGGIADPAFLADVDKFSDWLRLQPEVRHVDSVAHVMKRLNRNMHGDDPAFYKLPHDRDLAAQYLLLYEMSLPYGLDLNNQIDVDKSQTKITATLETLSSQEMIDFNQRTLTWARANLPAFQEIESAGVSLMFAYIGQRNNYSMLFGTVLALVLISGVMMLALRSLKIGLASLLPNLAPAGVAFGIWGMTVGEVGMSLSVVAGMTFGIVVDDSVHFLSKYLRARRENGLNAEQAVRYAFRTVGRALLVTSVVLVLGFSVVATSNFTLNSDMGLMTTLIIAIALATAFLMLPPLLVRVDHDDAAKANARERLPD